LNTSRAILKKYWGHDHFRPLQQDIIDAVLQQKDVLALLPTGGGKSICFQVPAMQMKGICLVISPLIALMKDQVERLNKIGIPSLMIHSGMHYMEVKKTLHNAVYGNFKFLYLSPERISTELFETYADAMNVGLIAVDESHCISQWGYDFRPAYLKIAALRDYYPQVPIIALTASATAEVQDDICNQLAFKQDHRRFRQSFARPNLRYEVIQEISKPTLLITLLKKNNGSGIVYCKSRKQTEWVAELLNNQGIAADFYHAGLSSEMRNSKQEKWLYNETRIIACTNAFGMGIDKPDVRLVIHFSIPESLENYYQEAGRAGRDGKPAQAILLFHPKEKDDLFSIHENRYPSPEYLKKLYLDLMNYLQIAAGAGEGKSYHFDMQQFSERFGIPMMTGTYGLQTLQQEGLFIITDAAFTPSKVGFITDKRTLYDLEEQEPVLDSMVKALLRSYEGIFDEEVSIMESKLATFMGVEIKEVYQMLNTLQRRGIIAYIPQTDKPRIILLLNRMYKDDFRINAMSIRKRKAKHLDRLNKMIDYAENQQACRSRIIANYFDEADAKDCGQCDNCLKQNKNSVCYSFGILQKQIITLLEEKRMRYQELLEFTDDYPSDTISQTIEFLIQEQIIEADRYGVYRLSAKADGK
jgi:ATP-dependent DNA helicase RecQ